MKRFILSTLIFVTFVLFAGQVSAQSTLHHGCTNQPVYLGNGSSVIYSTPGLYDTTNITINWCALCGTCCCVPFFGGTFPCAQTDTITFHDTIQINPSPSNNLYNSGGSLLCHIDSIQLSTDTASGYHYQWKLNGDSIPGATNYNYYVTQGGVYTVRITSDSGCVTTSLPNTIIGDPANIAPSICIVTVDTSVNNNVIVWEQTSGTAVDSFYIYRETNVTNVYALIGSQPQNAFSTFTDVNSNPQQQAYKYELGAMDSCGRVTPLSLAHKTIHLTISVGSGNTWNLNWNYYEGFNVASYNIYRGLSPSSMIMLTSVSGSMNSYTDLTPPPGTVYYQIEVVNPAGCNPSTKTASIFDSAKSNIASSSTPTVIRDLKTFGKLSNLYPNPTTGKFTISSPNTLISLEIYNVLGEKVYARNNFQQQPSKEIDLSNQPKGIYIAKIIDGKGIHTGKIVVE